MSAQAMHSDPMSVTQFMRVVSACGAGLSCTLTLADVQTVVSILAGLVPIVWYGGLIMRAGWKWVTG